jgi:hypothetical protein
MSRRPLAFKMFSLPVTVSSAFAASRTACVDSDVLSVDCKVGSHRSDSLARHRGHGVRELTPRMSAMTDLVAAY